MLVNSSNHCTYVCITHANAGDFPEKKESHPRPWIPHITAHPRGRWLGCYGRPGVVSPRLGALAAAGVLCRQAFCTSPHCSPSRASLYTGRDPHEVGVLGLTHARFGWDLDPGVPHLATRLAERVRAAAAGLDA
mgnify:FL=1